MSWVTTIRSISVGSRAPTLRLSTVPGSPSRSLSSREVFMAQHQLNLYQLVYDDVTEEVIFHVHPYPLSGPDDIHPADFSPRPAPMMTFRIKAKKWPDI